MRIKIFWVFIFFLGFTLTFSAQAQFYPEHDELLLKDNFWAEVTFEGDSVGVTHFRIHYPASAETVFLHLININALKKLHKSYADSKSLSLENYQKILQTQPENFSDLIALIQDAVTTDLSNRKQNLNWMDYWYMRFNLPWPFSDKWVVQEARVNETQAVQGLYRVEYKMTHGNLKHLSGWWEVQSLPNRAGWSEFRGETHSHPGLAIPQFLAKETFKSSLYKEFETNTEYFKKLASKPHAD